MATYVASVISWYASGCSEQQAEAPCGPPVFHPTFISISRDEISQVALTPTFYSQRRGKKRAVPPKKKRELFHPHLNSPFTAAPAQAGMEPALIHEELRFSVYTGLWDSGILWLVSFRSAPKRCSESTSVFCTLPSSAQSSKHSHSNSVVCVHFVECLPVLHVILWCFVCSLISSCVLFVIFSQDTTHPLKGKVVITPVFSIFLPALSRSGSVRCAQHRESVCDGHQLLVLSQWPSAFRSCFSCLVPVFPWLVLDIIMLSRGLLYFRRWMKSSPALQSGVPSKTRNMTCSFLTLKQQDTSQVSQTLRCLTEATSPLPALTGLKIAFLLSPRHLLPFWGCCEHVISICPNLGQPMECDVGCLWQKHALCLVVVGYVSSRQVRCAVCLCLSDLNVWKECIRSLVPFLSKQNEVQIEIVVYRFFS